MDRSVDDRITSIATRASFCVKPNATHVVEKCDDRWSIRQV